MTTRRKGMKRLADWGVERPRVRRVPVVIYAWLIALLAANVCAQNPPTDLTQKSLEDLMNIEVTSVSKKEERLFQTAAAVYVITQEDIRRSGLTSIPELLRLVPGLEVARIDGNKWAISARGFNGRFTNKLLVLMDGRSVYSPESSGVYWEAQDLLLEDIERIEIIRGPGGALWGANAVNGVINIITKLAKDTQGGLVTVGGGTEDRGFGRARYGGTIGDKAYYRVYGKYYNQSGLLDALGHNANDGLNTRRGGGRVDWKPSERDGLTLQGDLYSSRLRETSRLILPATPLAPPANTSGVFSGGNTLGRWNRSFSARSDLTLQLYFDRTRHEIRDQSGRIDTFDMDFQHHVAWGQRQDIVWGLGYRLITAQTNGNSGLPVRFDPPSHRDQLFSVFVQDEFTLVKDRLRLTLGTKLEHNDHSGFEVQPTARLLWTLSQRQTVWAAISRAVKTPALNDESIRVNIAAFPGLNGTPNILALVGNQEAKSEELRAYEFGYRVQPSHQFSLDLATFYNVYDRLKTFEPEQPFLETDPLPSHLVIPLRFRNLMRGETYGAEVSANWNVTSGWKLRGSYSFLRMQLHRYTASHDGNAEGAEGDSPRHQFQLHSSFRLPRNFELDASLYRVSRLANPRIPGYTRLDARIGWRVRESLELSVGLQNLLDRQHPEFNSFDSAAITSQAKRSVYGKVTWRF